MKTFLKYCIKTYVIALVVFSGCGKKLYTFEAEADGVPLKIYYGANANYTGGRLSINAVQFKPDTVIIAIDLNVKGPGTYICDSDDPKTGNVGAYFPKYHEAAVFATTSRSPGTVKITEFDLEAEKISGSFQFNALQVQPPGTKVIDVRGTFEDLPVVK
jgi:hypothetical protein